MTSYRDGNDHHRELEESFSFSSCCDLSNSSNSFQFLFSAAAHNNIDDVVNYSSDEESYIEISLQPTANSQTHGDDDQKVRLSFSSTSTHDPLFHFHSKTTSSASSTTFLSSSYSASSEEFLTQAELVDQCSNYNEAVVNNKRRSSSSSRRRMQSAESFPSSLLQRFVNSFASSFRAASSGKHGGITSAAAAAPPPHANRLLLLRSRTRTLEAGSNMNKDTGGGIITKLLMKLPSMKFGMFVASLNKMQFYCPVLMKKPFGKWLIPSSRRKTQDQLGNRSSDDQHQTIIRAKALPDQDADSPKGGVVLEATGTGGGKNRKTNCSPIIMRCRSSSNSTSAPLSRQQKIDVSGGNDSSVVHHHHHHNTNYDDHQCKIVCDAPDDNSVQSAIAHCKRSFDHSIV